MIVCIDTNAMLGMFGRAVPLLKLRHGLLAPDEQRRLARLM